MRWPAALALVALIPGVASATSIRFESVDLPDTTSGEDLWQYQYRVADFTFDAAFGFSIFFDHSLYRALDSGPVAPSGSWDVIALQPDANLPDDGIYDALSLTNSASLAEEFVISFVWLGLEPPGSQPFLVYEPGFETIETGTTVLVPEVTTFGSLLLGLVMVSQIVAVDNRQRRLGVE